MDPCVARCHLLAAVLAADGLMQEDERALLEEEMARLGLGEGDRDAVRHFEGAEGAAAALRGEAEAERRAVLDELVSAALVDGKLSPNETATVKRLAKELGLDD
jgi:uncharacterized tellurite resistance protein B-like protein